MKKEVELFLRLRKRNVKKHDNINFSRHWVVKNIHDRYRVNQIDWDFSEIFHGKNVYILSLFGVKVMSIWWTLPKKPKFSLVILNFSRC